MSTYVVNDQEDGGRVDSLAVNLIEGVSRSVVVRMIEQGSVTVNGKPVAKNYRVRTGDVLAGPQAASANLNHPPVQPEDIALDIIYEDNYLVAINKPFGMVVHPGNGNPTGTLVNALAAHAPLAEGFGADRPGIVHRLDKNTSGILLAAKTQEVHTALSALFAQRTIGKWYLGFCVGECPSPQGVIDAPLARDRQNPLRRTVRGGGKSARTGYRLLGYYNGIALMRFALFTGRNHQIRAHCAHVHLPIVGDGLYTEGDPVQRIEPLLRPFAYRMVKLFSRQALHAHRLLFTHPVTGVELDLRAPLPPDFDLALKLFSPHLTIDVDDFAQDLLADPLDDMIEEQVGLEPDGLPDIFEDDEEE